MLLEPKCQGSSHGLQKTSRPPDRRVPLFVTYTAYAVNPNKITNQILLDTLSTMDLQACNADAGSMCAWLPHRTPNMNANARSNAERVWLALAVRARVDTSASGGTKTTQTRQHAHGREYLLCLCHKLALHQSWKHCAVTHNEAFRPPTHPLHFWTSCPHHSLIDVSLADLVAPLALAEAFLQTTRTPRALIDASLRSLHTQCPHRSIA